MPNYKNGKIISYAGMGISTAAAYATTHLYPATYILLRSLVAFFATLYSMLKNQESVQLIQTDEQMTQERLRRLRQEDLQGFSEKNVIDLLNKQNAGDPFHHHEDISPEQFQQYRSQAQYWSTLNLVFQLLGFLTAQGIYQAANREADHEQPLHTIGNCWVVPFAMLVQMGSHMYCAHKINTSKNASKMLREKIEQKSHLYSDPGVRLAVLVREEQAIRRLIAEAQESIDRVRAERERYQAQIAQTQAHLRKETQPYRKDPYFLSMESEDTIAAWKNPDMSAEIQLLSLPGSKAQKYMTVFTQTIVPLIREIKAFKVAEKDLEVNENNILQRKDKLDGSLMLITPKVTVDKATLESTHPTTVFAI